MTGFAGRFGHRNATTSGGMEVWDCRVAREDVPRVLWGSAASPPGTPRTLIGGIRSVPAMIPRR